MWPGALHVGEETQPRERADSRPDMAVAAVERAEAHMIRTIRARRRGRPCGPTPAFVEDATRFDATTLLAKTRGAPDLGEPVHHCTLAWTDGSRRRFRNVSLPVTSTAQPLGGRRHWWRCPICNGRRGVLLVFDLMGPIACRRCQNAHYVTDYPSRRRDRRLVALMRSMAHGSLDEAGDRELNALFAKRRRGIRRGRRVLHRAARALVKVRAWPETLAELFDAVTRA